MIYLGIFELLTVDLHFSELCGIHRSVTLSRLNSLHQINARDFVKLKSRVKNNSYPFIQAEYHIFFTVYIYVTTLLSLQQKQETITVLKRQKYQPQNKKGFTAKKKSHRFTLTGWIITCKVILTYFLGAYKSEKKNEILHSSFSIKRDFDSYEFI